MFPRSFLVATAAVGILISATVVPAPFTLDENNYLVTILGLRQGRLTVPGTEDLPASLELLYFDPTPARRELRATPVSSTAPPLYAPLGLPFSYAGWRGLVALNTLAFLATLLVVFAFARRFAATSEAAWIAALAVGAGSYFIEYAQGLWPHMVTVLLVAGAALLSARALDERRWEWAAGAGFLGALAAGVRYQNAFVLGCLGMGLLLLSRYRFRATLAFAAGGALPLAASSIMNWMRLGSWNPMSKGPGYLSPPSGAATSVGKIATMAWARIVDYSARPPMTGTIHASYLSPHPESGAYVIATAVKKAWLQSSPWMIVPLALIILVWLPTPVFRRIAGDAPQRQIRLISLVVVPTLGMFSASGVTRTDGLCFNQRYFCELVPLMAVALAWTVEGIGRWRTAFLGGALGGAVLAFLSLAPHHQAPLRHYLVMYLPLAVAALLGVTWVRSVAARGRTEQPPIAHAALHSAAVTFMLGVSLGWAGTVHLGDDLQASRLLRKSRRDYLRELRPYIPDHSAVFAAGGVKDALGPLQLDLDVVIAAPAIDRGATTKELMESFLAQGRHVFFLPNVVPMKLFEEILEGKQVRSLGLPAVLIEVRPSTLSGPSSGASSSTP